MPRILTLIAFLFLACGGPRQLFAQESQPISLPLVEGNGDKLGEIIFFPGAESRPSEDRHPVVSGQYVDVCVKLNDRIPESLKLLKKYTVGFRLIMEDNQDPPQVLTVAWGDWLQWLKPDAQGCYSGRFQIPPTTKSSVYQVADLLIATNDYNYYSLREYLFDFSQVDELEVKNPTDDLKPPALSAISSYNDPKGRFKLEGGVARAKIEQIFEFLDEGTGIDKKSLRVFYQLKVDDNSQGFKEAKCRKRSGGDFLCKLDWREPFFEWSLRQVVFELSQIRIRDKAGNLTLLEDPQLFAEKAGANPVRFEFSREKTYKPKLLKDQKLF